MSRRGRPSRRLVLRRGLATGLMGIPPYRVQGRLGIRENGSNPLEPPDYEVFILSDDSDTERDRQTPSTVRRGIVNRGGEYVQITGQYTMRDGSTELSSVTNTLEGPVVSVYSEEASRSELNLLSATTMEVEGTTTIEGKAALATYGSNLLCAASEKGFFIFDYVIGYSLTGKATLPAPLQEKEMDEMVIRDDIAYIVDDVLFPWYLLRVGLSTKTDPTYLEVVEIGGVNQTLNHQWLNPAQNQWLLHQSTTTMAGNSENVIVTPMTEAATTENPRFLKSVPSEIALRDPDEIAVKPIMQPREGGGVELHDITTTPPIYASITVDDTHYLSSVQVDPVADTSTDEEADNETQLFPDDIHPPKGLSNQVHFGKEIELESPAAVTGMDNIVLALALDADNPLVSVFDVEQNENILTTYPDMIGDPIDIQISRGLNRTLS